MGRKAKDIDKLKSRMIGLRVTEDLGRLFDEMCADKDVSMSDFMMESLMKSVEDHYNQQ